jgi:hypothetical protein
MRARQYTDPAHTEYLLVCGPHRYYNGRAYRDRTSAQTDADAMNARRAGRKCIHPWPVEVAEREVPEQAVTSLVLPL